MGFNSIRLRTPPLLFLTQMNLLLPAAGQSSRFAGSRPKYLRTFPTGELMIERSIKSLASHEFTNVYLGVHRSHLALLEVETLVQIIEQVIGAKTFIHVIEESDCQPETCYQLIKHFDITGGIVIKDCDNSFEIDEIVPNSVAYVTLDDPALRVIDSPSAKSYLQIDDLGMIHGICEKRVISDKFSCGLYCFADSSLFSEAFLSLRRHLRSLGHSDPELYISNIIQALIAEGSLFTGILASSYQDYGTEAAFVRLTSSAATYFCDFDGVLVQNSGKFSPGGWGYEPISKNIEALRSVLADSQFTSLVITTSRPASHSSLIRQFLSK